MMIKFSITLLLACHSFLALSQTNHLSKRFGLISSSYLDYSCIECMNISNSLYNQMKNQPIFSVRKNYTSWIGAWNSGNMSSYSNIDFFLTSEVVKKSKYFLITFKLYDKKKIAYTSINLTQRLSKTDLQSDIVKVAEIAIDELNHFKSKGHFKDVILIDQFDPYQMEEDINDFIKDFTDWLTSILKKEDLLRLNYHVYGLHEINQDQAGSKVDGKFFKKKIDNVQMRMEIHLDEEKENCSTMNINIFDYENHEKEIVAEIMDKLNKLEGKKEL